MGGWEGSSYGIVVGLARESDMRLPERYIYVIWNNRITEALPGVV